MLRLKSSAELFGLDFHANSFSFIAYDASGEVSVEPTLRPDSCVVIDEQ